MNEVIEWLESPEGEAWSRFVHNMNKDMRVAALATIKVNYYDEELGMGREEWVPIWSVYYPHGVKIAPVQ